MIFSADELVSFVNGVFWPFVRIGAMFMAAPIFGSKSLPVGPRVLLTLMIAWVIFPLSAAHSGCERLQRSRHADYDPTSRDWRCNGLYAADGVFRYGGCRSNHGDQHGLGICRHDRPAKRGSGAGR